MVLTVGSGSGRGWRERFDDGWWCRTDAPRAARPTQPGSRHLGADLKRRIAQRDGHKCTFVADDGRRCNEIRRLEFHHEHPFGRGGPPTEENILLLCSTHNALLAERDYGREHIERRRRERTPPRTAVPDKLVELAHRGLCQLGFRQPVARSAVTRAVAELDANASLQTLVRCSLRHTRELVGP